MATLTLESTEPLDICWDVKRALGGQTPERLRAHFGETPSEQDLEDISVAETEIIADFWDPYEICADVEIVPGREKLSFLSGGIAYLRRGEAGTVCS